MLLAAVVLAACSDDTSDSSAASVCGRACSNCTPEPIALPAEAGQAVRVLVDRENLYVETEREDSEGHHYGVYKLPLDGSPASALWTNFEQHTDVIEMAPPGFELAHSSLYLLGHGNYRLSLTGEPEQKLPGFDTLRPVFLDDGMIVEGKSASNSIARLSPGGAEMGVLYDLGHDIVVSLARAGDTLFWVQSEQGKPVFGLYRGGLDGRAAVRLAGPVMATSGFLPNEIAADARHVYYIDERGRLVRANHDGQQVSPLTSAPAPLRSLGDGCTLASIREAGQSGVFMLSEQGGPMVKVAEGAGAAAADDRFIYVADKGKLGRVPRQR